MKINRALILVPLLSFALGMPSHAYKPGTFPGVGSYIDWHDYALRPFQEARELREEGKFDQAIAKIEHAIRIYQFDAMFYQELGYDYEGRNNSGDLELAESAFRKATHLNPEDWSCWRDFAYSLIRAQRRHEAEESLRRALQLNPPSREARAIKEKLEELVGASHPLP